MMIAAYWNDKIPTLIFFNIRGCIFAVTLIVSNFETRITPY